MEPRWQLFGVPAKTLTNTDVAGADLLGRGIEDLWAMLAESKSFSDRVLVAESYVLTMQTYKSDHMKGIITFE
jgi:hypothetical protein